MKSPADSSVANTALGTGRRSGKWDIQSQSRSFRAGRDSRARSSAREPGSLVMGLGGQVKDAGYRPAGAISPVASNRLIPTGYSATDQSLDWRSIHHRAAGRSWKTPNGT